MYAYLLVKKDDEEILIQENVHNLFFIFNELQIKLGELCHNECNSNFILNYLIKIYLLISLIYTGPNNN